MMNFDNNNMQELIKWKQFNKDKGCSFFSSEQYFRGELTLWKGWRLRHCQLRSNASAVAEP